MTVRRMQLLPLFVLLFAAASFAQDAKAVETSLRNTLKDHLLIFRTPYLDKFLAFDSQGQLTKGSRSTGSLPLGGASFFNKAKVSGNVLELSCKRVLLLALKGKPGLLPYKTEQELKIQITGDSPIATELDAFKLMGAVFISGDQYAHIQSDYWSQKITDPVQLNAARDQGEAIGMLQGDRPVYQVKHGVVEAGAIRHIPDPEIPADPLHRPAFGTAKFSVVLNEQGIPEVIELEQQQGSTFDWSSVQAVTQARFTPAMRSGTPVAIKVGWESSFNVY